MRTIVALTPILADFTNAKFVSLGARSAFLRQSRAIISEDIGLMLIGIQEPARMYMSRIWNSIMSRVNGKCLRTWKPVNWTFRHEHSAELRIQNFDRVKRDRSVFDLTSSCREPSVCLTSRPMLLICAFSSRTRIGDAN
jgi:hypothetical protein